MTHAAQARAKAIFFPRALAVFSDVGARGPPRLVNPPQDLPDKVEETNLGSRSVRKGNVWPRRDIGQDFSEDDPPIHRAPENRSPISRFHPTIVSP